MTSIEWLVKVHLETRRRGHAHAFVVVDGARDAKPLCDAKLSDLAPATPEEITMRRCQGCDVEMRERGDEAA